jgi:putative hydroxymethylpyrimidine transport system substrate-binding protein
MRFTMRHLLPIVWSLIAALSILASPPALAAEKLSVILEWFVNPDHAPLIVAREKGFFADEGLEVALAAPADPNDPPKLVAAGKADVGISYQPQLHLQVAEGIPVVRIGTLVATPLVTMMAMPQGGIGSLADLKGKRIGYSVAFYRDTVLPAMLAHGGLSLDDVETVAISFALSQALIAGRVEATIGAFRNFEINQMELVGEPGRPFFPEDHGVPPYDELIFIASEEKLGDPRLRRFLNALETAVQYLVNHPEESWRAFVAAHPDLDTELNRRAWRDTLPRFALRPAALDTVRYERFARFLEHQGSIRRVPPVSRYAVELR